MKNNLETFTELDLELEIPREPILWVFGCSHSFGIGLKSTEKNYATLMSEQLNMPLKLLAQPGSSTHYGLRHLVNADIREHDTVIWQLTNSGRFSYLERGIVREIILHRNPIPKFLDFFSDEQLFFQQLSLLNIGVMYLRAKKVKFIVLSIPNDRFPDELESDLIKEYKKYPEYCFMEHTIIVDKGIDNKHPGPLSHQKISQSLLNHIQSSNE